MYVFTGSLTRPMPQYGAANGRGITQLAWDAGVGGLSPIGETRGIDDADLARADDVGSRSTKGERPGIIGHHPADPWANLVGHAILEGKIADERNGQG